jgi:hypothetical protein
MRRALVLVAGLTGLGALAVADTPTTCPVCPACPDYSALAPDALNSMRTATDPSVVIGAYAIGVAADPKNGQLLYAYVGRMAELNHPDMADYQARAILKVDPKNPTALSVVAANLADRGEWLTALDTIARIEGKPASPALVQRVAGDIVSHFDRTVNTKALANTIAGKIERLRAAHSDTRAYAAAVRTANATEFKAACPPMASVQSQVIGPTVAKGSYPYSMPQYPTKPTYTPPSMYQPGGSYTPGSSFYPQADTQLYPRYSQFPFVRVVPASP